MAFDWSIHVDFLFKVGSAKEKIGILKLLSGTPVKAVPSHPLMSLSILAFSVGFFPVYWAKSAYLKSLMSYSLPTPFSPSPFSSPSKSPLPTKIPIKKYTKGTPFYHEWGGPIKNAQKGYLGLSPEGTALPHAFSLGPSPSIRQINNAKSSFRRLYYSLRFWDYRVEVSESSQWTFLEENHYWHQGSKAHHYAQPGLFESPITGDLIPVFTKLSSRSVLVAGFAGIRTYTYSMGKNGRKYYFDGKRTHDWNASSAFLKNKAKKEDVAPGPRWLSPNNNGRRRFYLKKVWNINFYPTPGYYGDNPAGKYPLTSVSWFIHPNHGNWEVELPPSIMLGDELFAFRVWDIGDLRKISSNLDTAIANVISKVDGMHSGAYREYYIIEEPTTQALSLKKKKKKKMKCCSPFQCKQIISKLNNIEKYTNWTLKGVYPPICPEKGTLQPLTLEPYDWEDPLTLKAALTAPDKFDEVFDGKGFDGISKQLDVLRHLLLTSIGTERARHLWCETEEPEFETKTLGVITGEDGYIYPLPKGFIYVMVKIKSYDHLVVKGYKLPPSKSSALPVEAWFGDLSFVNDDGMFGPKQRLAQYPGHWFSPEVASTSVCVWINSGVTAEVSVYKVKIK